MYGLNKGPKNLWWVKSWIHRRGGRGWKLMNTPNSFIRIQMLLKTDVSELPTHLLIDCIILGPCIELVQGKGGWELNSNFQCSIISKFNIELKQIHVFEPTMAKILEKIIFLIIKNCIFRITRDARFERIFFSGYSKFYHFFCSVSEWAGAGPNKFWDESGPRAGYAPECRIFLTSCLFLIWECLEVVQRNTKILGGFGYLQLLALTWGRRISILQYKKFPNYSF